jgi:hypothetical protein
MAIRTMTMKSQRSRSQQLLTKQRLSLRRIFPIVILSDLRSASIMTALLSREGGASCTTSATPKDVATPDRMIADGTILVTGASEIIVTVITIGTGIKGEIAGTEVETETETEVETETVEIGIGVPQQQGGQMTEAEMKDRVGSEVLGRIDQGAEAEVGAGKE